MINWKGLFILTFIGFIISLILGITSIVRYDKQLADIEQLKDMLERSITIEIIPIPVY